MTLVRRLAALGAGLFTLMVLMAGCDSKPTSNPVADTNAITQEFVSRLLALEAQERRVDETVWAKEMLAQQCGAVFEQIWDSLNASTNKLGTLTAFSFGELTFGKLKPAQDIGHDIKVREPAGSGQSLSAAAWRQFLAERQREGWQLAQTEFRHNRFDADAAGRPRQSQFYFAAHLTNSKVPERATLDGDLIVDWKPGASSAETPAITRIDASDLTLKTRRGEPVFQPVLVETIKPPEKSFFIDPLILYDLDGDGLSEIILAAKNLVFRRRAGDRFESTPLCRHSPGLIFTGLIADFDGDGEADFLCAKFEGLYLFNGSPEGTFDEPGQFVWPVNPHLKYGQVLTCGDLDGDGDLDVWLGQYKGPYNRGQMPTPYYDANDGNPSYLLLNDGHGNFHDFTAEAGLAAKRWRRTYSASFADFDSDGDLDLIVVSDFAGVDLYANDERGHFTDVTTMLVAEPHAAGMAHAFADFDGDGRLDLLMIGMNSPTVERLNHFGRVRPSLSNDAALRSKMMFGNRLYFARSDGPFVQTPLGDTIARTGWSWGVTAADFDNDGWLDAYIANGHETNKSARDYESEFWLHDAYLASSKDDPVLAAFFGSKHARTRGVGHSFGGYDKNRLCLNRQGATFTEAGHLLGVALEEDSRDVVADDLDGDGRLDLLVTTFEIFPEVQQTLRIFKNALAESGNWIGFRLREQGGGVSPVGARVKLHHAGGTMVRQIITGDSFRSQHANSVHFGLGHIASVDSVEIRWVNGRNMKLRQPAINQYHAVPGPRP